MSGALAIYSMLGTTNHGGHKQTMNPTDTLPFLVRSFVNDNECAAELLSELLSEALIQSYQFVRLASSRLQFQVQVSQYPASAQVAA